MKILALHLHNFISYAQLRGVLPSESMAVIHLSEEDFWEETSTIESSDFYAVVTLLHQKLKDDQLGLRLGEYLNLSALGLIYQISMQTTRVEEALFYLNNYLKTTLPVVDLDVSVTADEVTIRLSLNHKNAEVSRIILESTLTIIGRELTLMAANELDLRLYSPCYTSTYPAHWQKGDDFALAFQPVTLKASLQDISRLKLDLLLPEYLKLIESLKPDSSFASKVKIASLNMAKPELPDLEMVADVFNLTPRTLQRRLNSEKVTFRQIIDDLKKQLSYMLMQHSRFSVTDVSYVLGYSEPAAFIHSFQKWYGNSPDKMRGVTTS
jgi:AraC-like DNA-binding protein